MSQLNRFAMRDMTEIGAMLRETGRSAQSMGDAASRVTSCLYQELKDGDRPACKLIRFFKTHPYADLPPQLQEHARAYAHLGPPPGSTKCLTLLATIGAKPEWNSRILSRGHQAIPLLSEEMVSQAPMISQLIPPDGAGCEGLPAF